MEYNIITGDPQDDLDLMELCITCHTRTTPQLESRLAAQHDDYIFQLWALQDILGRDLAKVVTGYYYIVKMTEIPW
jgi:hypothetical protein